MVLLLGNDTRRRFGLYTYRVDPNAELGRVKGHGQPVCVSVDGGRVLVDSTSQQRSCCAVTIQHGGQQGGSLILCAAHRYGHTLS